MCRPRRGMRRAAGTGLRIAPRLSSPLVAPCRRSLMCRPRHAFSAPRVRGCGSLRDVLAPGRALWALPHVLPPSRHVPRRGYGAADRSAAVLAASRALQALPHVPPPPRLQRAAGTGLRTAAPCPRPWSRLAGAPSCVAPVAPSARRGYEAADCSAMSSPLVAPSGRSLLIVVDKLVSRLKRRASPPNQSVFFVYSMVTKPRSHARLEPMPTEIFASALMLAISSFIPHVPIDPVSTCGSGSQ